MEIRIDITEMELAQIKANKYRPDKFFRIILNKALRQLDSDIYVIQVVKYLDEQPDGVLMGDYKQWVVDNISHYSTINGMRRFHKKLKKEGHIRVFKKGLQWFVASSLPDTRLDDIPDDEIPRTRIPPPPAPDIGD